MDTEFDQVVSLSGIYDFKSINPVVLKGLLVELRIDDLDHDYITCLFDCTSSLSPVVDLAIDSIKRDHQTLVEFVVRNKSLLLTLAQDHPGRIENFLHRMFLLQHLTYLCQNDVVFLEQLVEHFDKKQAQMGVIRNSLFRNALKMRHMSGSVFMAFKLISIHPGVRELVFRRTGRLQTHKDLIQHIKKRELPRAARFFTKAESEKHRLKHRGLRLNIHEATINGYFNGFKDNAKVGGTLLKGLEDAGEFYLAKGHVHPDNLDYKWDREKFSENVHLYTPYSKDWLKRYHVWNTAFVLGDLPDPFTILPKLFIPSVIDAKQGDYMSARLISLWLTANTVLFRFDSGTHDAELSVIQKLLSKDLGYVNRKHFVDKK